MFNLPVATWGILLAILTIMSLASGIWLLLRARDVARVVDTPDNEIAPGRQRRPSAKKATVRWVLLAFVVATVGALGLFVLAASRVIGS